MRSTVAIKRKAGVEARLDRVFHALGDRTRRALLAQVAKGPAMITALAEPHAMSLAAVSKHIRVLEQAGLILRSVEGRVHRCSLAPGALRAADSWLSFYRAFWADSLESLARYVEAGDDDTL